MSDEADSRRPEPPRVLPEQPFVTDFLRQFRPAPATRPGGDQERAELISGQAKRIDEALAVLLAADAVTIIAGADVLSRIEAALWPHGTFPRSRRALSILAAPIEPGGGL